MARMICKSLFFTLSSLLLLISLNLQAQHSFQVLFESTNNKTSSYVIEDYARNFLIIGSEDDEVEGITKNKIWKISPIGDTSSLHIDIGNVQSIFKYVESFSDTAYLIIGVCGDTTNWLLFNELIIIQTDTLFNINWIKKYTFSGYLFMDIKNVIKDDIGYYVVGNISKNENPVIYYPFFFRLNQTGDTIRTSIYNTYSGGSPIENAMFGPDSAHIWWFSNSPPSPLGRRTRREVDTLFNFTKEDTLTHNVQGNICSKLISDTTFLLSCNYLLSVSGQPQDEDIGIFIYNKDLEALDFNHFGAPDTVDYPGRFQGIDFRDSDTLFYTGMKNVIFEFYPHGPSWIMIGQLNNNLECRYQRFYGGDTYYMPINIIATRDGGCLINSWVVNPELEINNFLIMKLNPEGLITGTKPLIAPLRYAIVRPNPASNLLIVEYTNQNGLLSIFDVNGKAVHQEMIHQGRNDIDISKLNAGIYIYQIQVESEAIESGKFIKL